MLFHLVILKLAFLLQAVYNLEVQYISHSGKSPKKSNKATNLFRSLNKTNSDAIKVQINKTARMYTRVSNSSYYL